MATPNQFREIRDASPFTPFIIRTASGKTITVKHPENTACSPTGREVVILDDDGIHHLEMLLIEEITRAPADTPTPANGS